MDTDKPEPQGGSGEKGDESVIVTKGAIVITLNEDEQRKAQECLKDSGKITISFREMSVTRLPQTLDDGKQID